MITEIEMDIGESTIYLSGRLTNHGKVVFPDLLREAAANGNDDSLAVATIPHLRSHGEPRKLKSGGFSNPPAMPTDAHTTLAEGEFNRYYIRAICVRSIEDDISEVIVYRAKVVMKARTRSESMVGRLQPVQVLLRDLRTNQGGPTETGIPGPNSGLSVRLP